MPLSLTILTTNNLYSLKTLFDGENIDMHQFFMFSKILFFLIPRIQLTWGATQGVA